MDMRIVHTLVVVVIGLVAGSMSLTVKILKRRGRIRNTMGAFILEFASTVINGVSLVVALCIMP